MRMSMRARVLAGAAAVAAATALCWQVADHGSTAAAAGTQSGTVNGGPDTFTQALPTGAPSQYNSPLERCANGVDHPIGGGNPILSEPATTQFTSNVPLTVSVRGTGDQWYGDRQLVFTNRSSKSLSVDCAVLIFLGPSGSDNHSYTSTQAYGHPQQDYVEVPKGNGTSYYIARLGFHDVVAGQRTVDAGQTFTYTLSGAPGSLTVDQIRDSIRFYADLDLHSNNDLVSKYGTNRLTN
ncbi:hypothetical protein F0L68_15850 [Solihabitans fulvus]|uniref:Uncharacterized protein n=1 Tax=Solihabitans fulvus TaxID=1892852 RepID=A0A5B2XEP2_9PSEU|nr:hypothetical protein [Solihabitans fulvus]KAA2261716.1 hypothetical protein F0L68_15850 [Solihabitans fulvus]